MAAIEEANSMEVLLDLVDRKAITCLISSVEPGTVKLRFIDITTRREWSVVLTRVCIAQSRIDLITMHVRHAEAKLCQSQ